MDRKECDGRVEWHFLGNEEVPELIVTFEKAGPQAHGRDRPFDPGEYHFYVTTPQGDTVLESNVPVESSVCFPPQDPRENIVVTTIPPGRPETTTAPEWQPPVPLTPEPTLMSPLEMVLMLFVIIHSWMVR